MCSHQLATVKFFYCFTFLEEYLSKYDFESILTWEFFSRFIICQINISLFEKSLMSGEQIKLFIGNTTFLLTHLPKIKKVMFFVQIRTMESCDRKWGERTGSEEA